MASYSDAASLSTLLDRLILMPLPLFPLFPSRPDTNPNPNPDHDSTNNQLQFPFPFPDRFVLINPFTQGMVVIGDSMLNDLRKEGQPPASETAIGGLPSVEVKSEEEVEKLGGECVICLEGFKIGDVVNEMPCKHGFHGECVKKWLRIHGTCPVCRYKMPVGEDSEKKVGESGGRRREVWVTFAVGGGGRMRGGDEGTVAGEVAGEDEGDS